MELDMYKYHSRELPFAGKSGMLPGMMHSLTQQLVSQDPVLYSVMVALRPDHATRLVAFPCHSQYSSEGDNTLHRRLDFNLEALVDHGLGRNIVQCAVSFENEHEDDSTMVWPGMHIKAAEWLKGLSARDAYHEKADRRVFQMSAHHMNEADKTTFGTFETRPLSKGGALFLHSSIPHGSSQARHNRKLVFPLFLEMLDSGDMKSKPNITYLGLRRCICYESNYLQRKVPGFQGSCDQVDTRRKCLTRLGLGAPTCITLEIEEEQVEPGVPVDGAFRS